LALASLSLGSVQLLNLPPFSLVALVQDDSKESTLNDILCLRNTGAENVLFAQESAIVRAEFDVDGAQFRAFIACVIISFCTDTWLQLLT
jgi:hypothetical protein